MDINVDASAISDLIKRLEKSPAVIQEAKRQAFKAAAPKLKAAVDRAIGGSGKVRSWQEARVGSDGGYAAVSPKPKTFAEDRRGQETRYKVGYVTGAISYGHQTPRNKAGYRTSSKKIAGRYFYESVDEDEVENIAQEAAEQIVQALTDHLGG